MSSSQAIFFHFTYYCYNDLIMGLVKYCCLEKVAAKTRDNQNEGDEMEMFCYQCQETAGGMACTGAKGVCGKPAAVSKMQDLSLHLLKGIAIYSTKARELGVDKPELNRFIVTALFETVTNVNFSEDHFVKRVSQALQWREEIKEAFLAAGGKLIDDLPGCATWTGSEGQYAARAETLTGKTDAANEDVRSLRSLIIYGLKGMSAYAEHACHLGYEDDRIYAFMQKALAGFADDTMSVEDAIALVLETGQFGVEVMALLDKANTTTYGNPEISKVNLGVGKNPGILVSGHDLKDFEELLIQTKGTGVDVYTHSEMLPGNYYPAFNKQEHLIGNYGGSWWEQAKEFETFNGPILMTTNCLAPPKESYQDRVYVTGTVRFDGLHFIEDREEGKQKDFSAIIEHAKRCSPPQELETGEIVGGFAHHQVLELADKVVGAVKSGAIKKFVVMAGCDGRKRARGYYTDFAAKLPKDTVILTAGCAKYRYNKLDLGDIDGIPRVLDAGQCNDSYSLAVIALKLKEVFNLDDINDLPIVYNIAWYEQKAVLVLLALLHLGVKNIHLGPTLPAFLSPNVAKVLIDTFQIGGIDIVETDMEAFMQ